jgi:tRNA-dihydrouridine synthase B
MVEPLRLGSLEVTPPLILAPMAGVTNSAFRLLCSEQGAGLVFTEMVSDKGLLYDNPKTSTLLERHPNEGPVGIQLFGARPETLGAAAKLVSTMGFECIDINMGCPVPKVAERSGAGAALMKDTELAAAVVLAVVEAVEDRLPVTVKMRSGWDAHSINAVEVAREVVAAGASIVSVHARTRDQGYSGKADYEVIRRVKDSVSVPVCGSGDVFSPEAAVTLLDTTGCDGVLIARGALGNPWIFSRTQKLLETGEVPPTPGAQERLRMLSRHFELLMELKGEGTAVREIRKHAAWYTKGLYNSSRFRDAVNRVDKQEDFTALVGNYAQKLADR